MRPKPFIVAGLLAGLAFASARTWTSADGERAFDGEMKNFDSATGKVTLVVNDTPIVFDQSKLSEEDRDSFLTGRKRPLSPKVMILPMGKN